MGTTSDKLNKLIETKAAIKTAITNKGVEVSDTDTFSSYASKIDSISSGDFSIPDGTSFAYSKWYSIPEWLEDYLNNIKSTSIFLADNVLSHATITGSGELELNSNENWSKIFDYFTGKNITVNIDCSKGVRSTSYGMFREATFLEIKLSNTENVTSFEQWFFNTKCRKISTITFSLNNLIDANLMFNGNEQANYMLIKNMGAPTITYNYDLRYAQWGIEDESYPETVGARQSLIDSLITYSYDRVAHNLENININLSTNTKALLTEDEIAQITAKGFTIS